MNRRKFIKASVIGGLATGVGGSALWFSIEPTKESLTIDAALAKLEGLPITKLSTTGEWNLYQIFTHCAQSVEYSMSGFPQHKPELFKNTVGQLAFSLFSSKGKMTHSLSEAIPGAKAFSSVEETEVALARFKKSMIAFKAFEGNLAPHFAYGDLSKEEYEIAHAMHFYNHLQEVQS